jgi:hypothetical protein
MTNTILLTNNGKKIFLNRISKSTPDYTELNQFKVGTEQDDPTINDEDLTNPADLTGSGVYFKNFVSGYPTINETELYSIIRCFLETNEANGNELNGFGIFNSDSTEKLGIITKFSSVTKNEYNQVAFVVKIQVI